MIDIHELMESKIIFIVKDDLDINHKAREWCKMPYPDHDDGCPNYNKKKECPPKAPFIEDFICLDEDMWFVIVKFNLKKQEERLREKHPDWSTKRCRCCLYWQGSVKKELKNTIKKHFPSVTYVSTLVPEAMGVNVLTSVKKIGYPIKRNPEDIVYKVALVGRGAQRRLDDYGIKIEAIR